MMTSRENDLYKTTTTENPMWNRQRAMTRKRSSRAESKNCEILLFSTASDVLTILVPRGRAPFGQHQKSRPLARSNTGSPRFTDFPSLCACSELSLTNVIGSGLNLLCLQSHSKPECRWTGPEVVILVLTKRSAASGDENDVLT